MITLTEEMFAEGKPFAQGEVVLWMKKYAPKWVLDALDGVQFKEVKLDGDSLILGHSETGHHHVLEPEAPGASISARVDAANDNFMEVNISAPCKLVHMRSFDTHEGFLLPPGEYIRRIREESTVDGWVRVAD